MIAQTRLIIVDVGSSTYLFRIRIHRAESPADQLIETAFYQEFANTVHTGTHYEMELVESPVWKRVNPNVPIHIHQNPDSELHFICFTGKIATLEAALAVLRTWCVGTIYAMIRNEDFGHLVGEQFFSDMKDLFGITIAEDFEITH